MIKTIEKALSSRIFRTLSNIFCGDSEIYDDYYNNEYFYYDKEHLCLNDLTQKLEEHFPENHFLCKKGATKIVIICDEWDFILKIPFSGAVFTGCEWSEPEPFSYETGDYCETEVNVYDEVIRFADYEETIDMFAEIKYLYSLTSCVPVYYQEKVYYSGYKLNYFLSKRLDKKDYDAAERFVGRYFPNNWNEIELSTDVISYLLMEYKEEVVEDLCYTIIKKHIADLHNENYGIDKDGKFKIFDYSSYWE